jgi:hypothetical protein
MGRLAEFFDSPGTTMAVVAMVAIVGLVAIGVTSFFCQAKTAETLAAVVKTLDGVLMIGLGAKAGLAQPSKKE